MSSEYAGSGSTVYAQSGSMVETDSGMRVDLPRDSVAVWEW